MGLSFLVPAFLLGLGALAVPIVVHLIHRQRSRTVEFPSLMFVRRVPFPSARRRRLRHPALLALRLLALALLVAAFARPFLTGRTDGPAAAAAARDVVVLLDRSWSMGYGERWAAAVAAAERVVDGLGPDDRASVVVFDEHARALGPPTGDRDRLRAELASVSVGSGRTRFAPALELAGSILDGGTRPDREAVLVSDFQRSGWDADAPTALPAGARLTTVPVGGPGADLAVTDVAFARQARAGAETVTATARVANLGPDSVADARVTLELAGQPVSRKSVTVGPGASAAVAFDGFALSAAVEGDVHLSGDALPADDHFRFRLEPGQATPVLLLGRAGASLFLRRALEIGGTPGFAVSERQARGWTGAGLPARGVVILDDAPLPGGEAGRRLRTWVEAGGGLVVAAGRDARWSGDANGLMPAAAGTQVDRDDARGGALGRIDFSHPVFEPFAAPHSGDFTAVRFFRQRALQPADSARVLARFDDGAVALAERHVGRGRVLLWASTLDNDWSDLVVQPVFLPFVHELVRYAAGFAPARPSLTVGDVWQPDVTGPAVALSPSGVRSDVGGPGRAPAVPLDEAGFWEIRHDGDGAASAGVAVNVDPTEADLAPVDPAEVAAAVTAPAAGEDVSSRQSTLTAADREKRQGWWWYLLAAAFVLFAAEPLVSNRLSTAGG